MSDCDVGGGGGGDGWNSAHTGSTRRRREGSSSSRRNDRCTRAEAAIGLGLTVAVAGPVVSLIVGGMEYASYDKNAGQLTSAGCRVDEMIPANWTFALIDYKTNESTTQKCACKTNEIKIVGLKNRQKVLNKKSESRGYIEPVFKVIDSDNKTRYIGPKLLEEYKRKGRGQVIGAVGYMKPCEVTRAKGCRIELSKNCTEVGKRAEAKSEKKKKVGILTMALGSGGSIGTGALLCGASQRL